MLTERVRKTIGQWKLIEKNQHIVLGLSGGPDSVCLFHILMRLRGELNLSIYPVHLNHKFRPIEAERDQRYTEELCRSMGVTCRTFTVDCVALAKELSMTSEEAGRKARYDAFYETAEDVAAKLAGGGMDIDEARASVKIAVAQNANDQAETIMFRLLRGTGTDGLAGIAYEREERGFKVIRPLMDIYRDDIEDYCRANGLTPMRDHTNDEAVYARNKIRLELLPLLERDYNENIKESLVRLGRIAAKDKEYIWAQTEREYRRLAEYGYWGDETSEQNAADTTPKNPAPEAVIMDRAELSRLHDAIRHRLIMRAFAEIGLDKDISEERIQAADAIILKKQAPKTVEFPRGYRLTVAKGKVMFYGK